MIDSPRVIILREAGQEIGAATITMMYLSCVMDTNRKMYSVLIKRDDVPLNYGRRGTVA